MVLTGHGVCNHCIHIYALKELPISTKDSSRGCMPKAKCAPRDFKQRQMKSRLPLCPLVDYRNQLIAHTRSIQESLSISLPILNNKGLFLATILYFMIHCFPVHVCSRVFYTSLAVLYYNCMFFIAQHTHTHARTQARTHTHNNFNG